MHEAGHSKSDLWDNPEGWGWEGDGREVQDGETHVHPWLIHVDIWQKPSQYCKVIILQLKLIKKRRVKFIESESTLVDAGVGWGRKCLMGTKFQFRKVENSGDG